MNSKYSCDIPILFCFFCREDTAIMVFEQIQLARPKKLYLHSDGPRNPSEERRVASLRKHITQQIDWDCEIHTLFRENNLGCNCAITGAISWLFEQEEWGIILEDDCVPSASFFPYCAENLRKYKNVPQILHIAGYTTEAAERYFLDRKYPYSYAFTGVMSCWGWATWRRAFEYRQNKFEWRIWKSLASTFSHLLTRIYYFRAFSKLKVSTWDWDWSYAIFKREGLCISPVKNLVANIGIESSREDSTICKDEWRANTQSSELEIPLRHPQDILINSDLGCLLIDYKEWLISLPQRAVRKILKQFALGMR